MSASSASRTRLSENAASTRVNDADAEPRAHGQLELPSDGNRSLYRSAWKRVLTEVKETVAEITIKEVAFDMDESKSNIEHCLEERERHYFRAEWLVYLALRSKHPRLAALLPAMRGFDLTPKKKKTAEQRIADIEKRAAMLGEPIQRFLFDEEG